MMLVAYVVVGLLGLLSVGRSAPVTDCDSLTKHSAILGRDQLLGRWTYIAESTNIAGSKLLTKMFVDNIWGKVTAAEQSNVINSYQSQKMYGRCFSIRSEATIVNNTLLMVEPYNATAVMLNTSCPDCIVLHSHYNIDGRTYIGVQLLSRRDKVSAVELQEFKKQVQCLNLSPPAVLHSEKGFCPDESSSQDPQAIDLTSAVQENISRALTMFESIVNTEGGLASFVNLISGTLQT